MSNYSTREEWLNAAAELLGTHIKTCTDMEVPPIQVSPGWPHKGGYDGGVLGECWDEAMTEDGTRHIFLNPIIGSADLPRLLDVLLHEMLHACCDHAAGDRVHHTAPFARAAKACGLEGKPTATFAEVGSELHGILEGFVSALGHYPGKDIQPVEGQLRMAKRGKKLDRKAIKKKGSRSGHWVKFESKTLDGYIVRVSPVSLREHGVPRDPKGDEMKCVDKRYDAKGQPLNEG